MVSHPALLARSPASPHDRARAGAGHTPTSRSLTGSGRRPIDRRSATARCKAGIRKTTVIALPVRRHIAARLAPGLGCQGTLSDAASEPVASTGVLPGGRVAAQHG